MAEENGIPELQFFGKVTASLSHDLKNVLAIVNENAGLIEDMLTFAGRGPSVNPERLIKAAQAINIQVRRGEAIIKNLNRFSHSTDETIADIALDQAVEVSLGITARMAAMRGVVVAMTPIARSLRVKTAPFAFQELMWRCLDKITAAEASLGGSVNITIETTDQRACIRLKGKSGRSPGQLTSQKDLELLGSAGAEARVDTDTGEMIITLNHDTKLN